jgi:uncharacterized membrane protein HdeD (DUF308 family)
MAVTSTQTIVVGGRVQGPLTLARHLLGRGLLAVAAGGATLAWPSRWLSTVTVVLGASALALGLSELVDGARRRRLREDWSFETARGVLTTGLGLSLLVTPDLAPDVLAVAIGAVWVVDGALELVEGLRARRGAREGRWRTARGIVLGAAGLLILVWPSITVSVLAYLVGSSLVVFGTLCLGSSRALRDAGQGQRDVRLDIVS